MLRNLLRRGAAASVRSPTARAYSSLQWRRGLPRHHVASTYPTQPIAFPNPSIGALLARDPLERIRQYLLSNSLQFSTAASDAKQSELSDAASRGDVARMKKLLAAGVDVNKANPDARTALHVAASNGQAAAAEFLVKSGAQVNLVDRWGSTPLGEAVRGRSSGHRAVVKVLQENGATIQTLSNTFQGTKLDVSLENSLPILNERGNFSYVEAWTPTNESSEWSLNAFYAEKEVLEKLGNEGVAASVGQLMFRDANTAFGKAFTSKKAVISALNAPDDRMRGWNTLIVPVVQDGTVFAVLKFYSQSPITLSNEATETFSAFCSHIVAAGVFGTSQEPVFATPPLRLPPGQMAEVYRLICSKGVFNANLIYHEVDWFYNHLGMKSYYFARYKPALIANHLHSLISAKQFAITKGNPDEIWLQVENNFDLLGGSGPEQALWMVPYEHSKEVAVQRRLQKLINRIPEKKAYSVDYFLTSAPSRPNGAAQLGIYVLQTTEFANPAAVGTKTTNIWDVASVSFLELKTKQIRTRYQELLDEAANRLSPVLKQYEPHTDGTIPLMFAFSGSTSYYMQQLTELLKQNNLVATRRFIESFANGITVFSLYVKPTRPEAIETLMKQVGMLHLVPNSQLTNKFLSGDYSPEEYTYLSAASRFIFYFLNQTNEDFESLSTYFSEKKDSVNLSRLRIFHRDLKRMAVSPERIHSIIEEHPQLAEDCFVDFDARIKADAVLPPNVELANKIRKAVPSGSLGEQVFKALATFNQHIVKTNFYKPRKSALSFRLNPIFLTGSEWPECPYGLFFVMGIDFQGFHVRFRDIARGGIRMIRSRDQATYSKNLSTLFAETYNLANTQNKKNKDIPEFGAKGTILLNKDREAGEPGRPSDPFLAFKKYISSMMDLINANPGITDLYKRPELLFFGPDEGTADYMQWACEYAKTKGYPYWRSITTGKPPSMGGIPHDKFGMTTRSVHRYVLGSLKKLGLDESTVTKLQTGGPDGDLGSNEILLSKDKTIAIVDVAGVVYDPAGLNREEITRLAKLRATTKNFDRTKLGPGGFHVKTDDKNVTLPNGELVESGVNFRNEFHLHPLSTADLFVPCGGRPEAVNNQNVRQLFHENGQPRFKIIVEGANLFFTQDARAALEKAGVVLYKDASSNKGGVTSSSLEVLAGLSLNDSEFEQHMAVSDPANPPQFYRTYVSQIQKRIEADADAEFECIWREFERSNKQVPRHILTDRVSDKINTLTDFILQSDLYKYEQLRNAVITRAVPPSLVELIGLENVIKRVPDMYLRHVFGSYLAAKYVYEYGINANEFAFFSFMQKIAPFVR